MICCMLMISNMLMGEGVHAACEFDLGCVSTEEVTLRSRKWVLTYPARRSREVVQRKLIGELSRATTYIETNFRPFREPVEVSLVEKLSLPRSGKSLRRSIGGFAGRHEDGTTFVVVKLSSASESKFRHELFHAWLRQHLLNPPQGLEEGIAELIEDDFNEEMYSILLQQGGPLRLRDLSAERIPPGPRERYRRASYWVALYYRVHSQPDLQLIELLDDGRQLDAQAAWRWLRR